jgi:hypothetical protein
MNDNGLLRVGAAAAVAGAIAQLIATVVEPDWGGDPATAARVVAANRFWTGGRLLDLVGALLTVGGLTVVGRTLYDGPGGEWARLGQPFLVLMGALGASAVAVGASLQHLAHTWVDAAAPAARHAYLANFDATARVTENLFFCAFLALGLYLATLGAGILIGRGYARSIGWTAAVSAVLMLAGNLLELVIDAAFVAVLAGFVLFLGTQIALGVSMWRSAREPRLRPPREPATVAVATGETWSTRRPT